ncbi:MAG: hypothetical protein GY835_14925 [bacterium]|nr:hypothetical protein [bacterium]
MQELITGPAGSGKTTYCIDQCLQALAAGREVVYLVPNYDETIQVRQRLLAAAGTPGLILPGIIRFSDLVRRVLDAGAPGWGPRPPLARRLHLTRLLAAERDRLGPLESSANSAGFPEVLDRFFRELTEGALQVSDLTALAGERRGGSDEQRLLTLARLYERFNAEQDAGRRLDDSRAMARAADLLESDPHLSRRIAGDEALLILDGFSNLSPLQLRFLNAVIPTMGGSLLTVCLPPADLDGPPRPPFERLHRLADNFPESSGWRRIALPEPRRYGTPLPQALATRLFRVLPGEAEGIDDDLLHLIRGATRRDEVDGLVRDLRRRLASGVSPETVAILYRDEQYAELLAELLRRERIPFRLLQRSPLLKQAAVDACLALLDWSTGQPVPDLVQRLRGGLVTTPDRLLAEIHAQARAAGIPTVLTWDDLLADIRKTNADSDWSWVDWKRSLPDEKLTGPELLTRVLKPLVELLRTNLINPLRAALQEPVEADEAAGGGATRMREAARESLALQGFLSVATIAAEEAVAPEQRLSLDAWTTILRRALDGETIADTPGGDLGGVLLGNPFALRLPELDTVYVCGLNQGCFPPPFRDHPLLRESERRQLNRLLANSGRNARLPEWQDRQAEERYLFYIAVTRASGRLVLSWAQRGEQGRVAAPSFFLDELRHVAAALPEPVDVPALSLNEKLRDPLNLRALVRDTLLAGNTAPSKLAEEAECWLREQGLEHLLLDARLKRSERSLAGHQALALQGSDRRRFSASRLEAYTRCPYSYLMEKVLGLEEEGDFEAGALEEGRLFHKALELLFSDWAELRDELIGKTPDEEELSSLSARYHDMASDKLEAEGLAALQSSRFRAERPRRLRVLTAFLVRDLERLRQTGAEPDVQALERLFTLESRDLAGADPATPEFDLVGVIDRVDKLPDGARLVIDYKRSKRMIEEPDLDHPNLFQLALYGLAEGAAVAGSAYCALKEKKPLRGYFDESMKDALGPWVVRGPRGSHWLDDAGWQAWLSNVCRRIMAVAAEIEAGRFAPIPIDGERTCPYCDFAQLCRGAVTAQAADGSGNVWEEVDHG